MDLECHFTLMKLWGDLQIWLFLSLFAIRMWQLYTHSPQGWTRSLLHLLKNNSNSGFLLQIKMCLFFSVLLREVLLWFWKKLERLLVLLIARPLHSHRQRFVSDGFSFLWSRSRHYNRSQMRSSHCKRVKGEKQSTTTSDSMVQFPSEIKGCIFMMIQTCTFWRCMFYGQVYFPFLLIILKELFYAVYLSKVYYVCRTYNHRLYVGKLVCELCELP